MLTALPSRIDADELAFRHGRRTDILLAAASGWRLKQVVETTATPSSARETFIGRGKPDQGLSDKI